MVQFFAFSIYSKVPQVWANLLNCLGDMMSDGLNPVLSKTCWFLPPNTRSGIQVVDSLWSQTLFRRRWKWILMINCTNFMIKSVKTCSFTDILFWDLCTFVFDEHWGLKVCNFLILPYPHSFVWQSLRCCSIVLVLFPLEGRWFVVFHLWKYTFDLTFRKVGYFLWSLVGLKL